MPFYHIKQTKISGTSKYKTHINKMNNVKTTNLLHVQMKIFGLINRDKPQPWIQFDFHNVVSHSRGSRS